MRQIILAFSVSALMCGVAIANPVTDFIACDSNKDGLLQKAEFQAFVKRRADAGNASAKWVVTFGAWGRALSTVDYNKDGQVSGDELRKYDANS
jgi:Ca2+-binding EF-hand superfamily protein